MTAMPLEPAAPLASSGIALDIQGLCVSAQIDGQSYKALDGVCLSVERGQAHGLVGESGSGKSLTLRAIMGLLPQNIAVTSGTVRFHGRDLLADGGKALFNVRGAGISMVFQEPAIALNPVLKVGRQITDAVAARRGLNGRQARELAVELMDQVGIHEPQRWVNAYPHQLSGGMRQRVMIASAVACDPEVILCDEPTTALDVTVQAQILNLFRRLQSEFNAGLLYVTHDLSVVATFCHALSVMYAGRIVEQSDTISSVLKAPAHPYTRALLASVPRLKGPAGRLRGLPSGAPPLTRRGQDPAPAMGEVASGWRVAPVSAAEMELFRSSEA